MSTQDSSKNHLCRMLQRFIAMEASAGLFMMLGAVFALLCANSNFSAQYFSLISTSITLGFGENIGVLSLKTAVVDVLMILFFFLVGMELKREMYQGALAEKGQKILPLIAAFGGIVFPALIYFLINHNYPESHSGWAIPAATDIAFALCVLTLLGKKVPASAKAFLLAIAIYDDLAAIIIIALFYGSKPEFAPLIYSAFIVLILFYLNIKRVRKITPYVFLGILLSIFLHKAGIHTTIAGVIVGVLIPLQDREGQHSPLNHAIHALHPWVAFAILPLFAFVSAGVSLQGFSFKYLSEPLTLGIILGLFLGKQIGIFSATFLAVKLKIAPRPQGASWLHIYGVSVIAGVGFTMSLFIGMLAFTDLELQNQVKIGVLSGSLLSALFGALIFDYFFRSAQKKAER
jgi:NhaA family Na+:H+ antiporter